MSGDCESCGEHCLDCKCKPYSRCQENGHQISINVNDLFELIHWARRYCDHRATYAPTRFNNIYKIIRSEYPDTIRCHDEFDATLMHKGAYWPYAQDGMYNEKTGAFDARK